MDNDEWILILSSRQHHSTSFHVLRNLSYSEDIPLTNPNCIINFRSSLIGLCSTIFLSEPIVKCVQLHKRFYFQSEAQRRNYLSVCLLHFPQKLPYCPGQLFLVLQNVDQDRHSVDF